MLDIFGFELFVGDTVAFHDSVDNRLATGTIDHIYPNKPDLVYIKYYSGYANKAPDDVVKRIIKPGDLKLIKFAIGSDQ